MKRKLLIFAISILVIVIGLILTANFWLSLILDTKVREPKLETPIIYNIGWWAYQDALQVDSFSVETVDSRLSLFNSFSLIEYNVKGQLVVITNGFKPYVEKIHMSERLILNDSTYNKTLKLVKDTFEIGSVDFPTQAIIEITPIINVKKSKSSKVGDIVHFDITNEHKIQSLDWGYNYYLIKCDSTEIPLVLQQTK